LVGAALTGLDLSRAVSAATASAIRRAWLENLLLVFPMQGITDEQQLHPEFWTGGSRGRDRKLTDSTLALLPIRPVMR